MKIEDKTTALAEAARKKYVDNLLYIRSQNSLTQETRFFYQLKQWLGHPLLSFRRFLVLRASRDPNSIYNQDKKENKNV
jgi:hypothetical protein